MSKYYLVISIRDKDDSKFSEDHNIDFFWNKLEDVRKWVTAILLIIQDLIFKKVVDRNA